MEAIGAEGDLQVGPSSDERFGDYQCNCAMRLAKQLGDKPREVAQRLVDALEIDDLAEPPEIAGPGFINLKIKTAYVEQCLAQIPAAGEPEAERLGIPRVAEPQTVVVDLSSPNLAKEMHVGHLRSTVIGDSLSRVLEFQGHEVHRENHVGDWGTQFGMLVAYLRRTRPEVIEEPDSLEIRDLEAFYIEAKALFDGDPSFKKESQETVIGLQQGEPRTRRVWRAFCTESLRHCHEIYRRLDVQLVDRGESHYALLMPQVVERLQRSGMLVESDGARVVFLPGFTTREGEPLPLIVQKRDGGYNYATSDLATILERVETLGARRILYVVGIAQRQHFEMVFAAVRQAGWAGDTVAMEHLGFGNMLAPSGKPFKTREGGTFKLRDLLDEAVAKARSVVERGTTEGEFSAEEVEHIAQTVGLSAVKYFDLSHSLQSDYKFDLDTMLALEGNTAPYMLYAVARIRSIGRNANVDFASLSAYPIRLEHPVEIALAKKLLGLVDVIDQVARDSRLNFLTEYLYDLSRTFSRFYDRKLGVRVVDASPENVRQSRLRLCELTARTLDLGLSLLGIRTLDRM